MYSDINLNLLKYFYEAVNIGNITKASERMLVSQPAITKAIKELESQLNVTLLKRNKKGVIPTEEGKILYEHIKTMFQDFNSTLNVLENTTKNGGHLYIGATTTNFIVFIKDALRTFKKMHPNVHIHIELENINTLSESSKLGHLDILIKNNYENMESFTNIKSFTINDQFVASSIYYPELRNTNLSLNELLKYPFVLLSPITHGRRNFDTFLKAKNIDFKPTYEFNSYSLCHELIKNGFGIGIGNPIHYKSKDFIIIKTDFQLPSRKFDIGYINTSKNKLIKNFIEILSSNNKNDI